MTGQSEGLDVETDGRHIGLVAVGKEADDAAVVHDGDVEGLGFLDGVTNPKRSVGPEVGDNGEVGDAVASITVEAVEPVNSSHELIRAEGNCGRVATVADPLACGMLQAVGVLVGEGEGVEHLPMADGDGLQAQRRYGDVAVALGLGRAAKRPDLHHRVRSACTAVSPP